MFNSRIALVLAAPVLLAGCAALPVDRGRSDVVALLKERGLAVPAVPADAEAARRILEEVAGRPLSIHDAVRIALVSNPRLKAEYARLGFASADVYDAGRLSNPKLSFGYLFVDESGVADKIDLGLTQNFTDLLLLPARSRFAKGEFGRVQQVVAAEVLRLAAEVESAYYDHVSAKQLAAMRDAVARAARTSADLAQRFFDAGNISRVELSREKAGAAQARLDALQAQAMATRSAFVLSRLMGLPSSRFKWQAPAQLPAPVAREDSLDALLALADRSRLDLAASRKQVELLADALGITRRFRYLGEIEFGVQGERDTDRTRHLGPTLSLELPIFNRRAGTVARAEAELQIAEAELAGLEVDAATGIQAALADVENARTRAEAYRAALIPQRESVVARTQELQNYMIVGQFELLAAKQAEYDAYQGYLEAVRDYWLARTELMRQVGAPLPSSAAATGPTLDVDVLIAPKESGMKDMHEGHDMKGMHPGHDLPTGMESQAPRAAADRPPVKADKPARKPEEDEAGRAHDHDDDTITGVP